MEPFLADAIERATDTQEILISRIDDACELFDRHFPGSLPIVIADSNTFGAAGIAVDASLRALYPSMDNPIVLPGLPPILPKKSTANDIAALIKESNATPIAVGSGTINDIVKLAAHRSNRSYMVVATAASMDGYASFGASMLLGGRKVTIPCPAPRAVLTEPGVLRSAPRDMTSAGYADLVGKITAGADWIIADAMGVERIDRDVWGMVQPHLASWIGEPEMIHDGNGDAFIKD